MLAYWVSAIAVVEAMTPGTVRSYSTIESIGVEWDVEGDDDRDSTASVRFRPDGGEWAEGYPLLRIDHGDANMLAGSVFFLSPGTRYEIELSLSDSDGTTETRSVSVSTRAWPELPSGGNEFHVRPGASGDGSEKSPFGSVEEADDVAVPGDIVWLHGGDYGADTAIRSDGTEDNLIAWMAADDEEAVFEGLRVAASHLWFEGLTIRGTDYGMVSDNDPQGVVVRWCTFEENDNAIVINDSGSANWVITDNTITGTNVVAEGSFSGEGVDLGHTDGHVVAYNRISLVSDGVSYPGKNVDIYGNDIFDTSDDGIEPDYGTHNIRIWGNRIHNAYHNGISFQTQDGGPWYILRNQIVGSEESPFKFRGADRFVVAHNTLVGWDTLVRYSGHELLGGISRNNLWLSVNGGRLWDLEDGVTDWRTDMDYDGFDWGSASDPFKYGGVTYGDITSFASASGEEQNGIEIDAETCLTDMDIPEPPPASVPGQVLSLAKGCPAIDHGVILPNLGGDHRGKAPDLGAFEYGEPTPLYGPRVPIEDTADTGENPGTEDTGPPSDSGIAEHTGGASDSDTGSPGIGDTQKEEVPSGTDEGDPECGCTARPGTEPTALGLWVTLLLYVRRRSPRALPAK